MSNSPHRVKKLPLEGEQPCKHACMHTCNHVCCDYLYISELGICKSKEPRRHIQCSERKNSPHPGFCKEAAYSWETWHHLQTMSVQGYDKSTYSMHTKSTGISFSIFSYTIHISCLLSFPYVFHHIFLCYLSHTLASLSQIEVYTQ